MWFFTLQLFLKFLTMQVRRVLKVFAERFVHHLDILMRQYHSKLLLITNNKHHNSLTQDGTHLNEEEERANSDVTDVNKHILITALAQHSNGRYSNLANAKGKWAFVVSDFQKATGWLVVQLQS